MEKFISNYCISTYNSAFFNDELILSGTYDGNYSTIYNNPIYSLLLEYTYISVSVFNGILILKNKKIKFLNILIAFTIVLEIYSSNKIR